MNCCGTINGLDQRFDRKRAQKELKRYERKGLSPSGRVLVQALEERAITGADVLEIGFGIGALHLELLKAGAASAVGLELSPAYVEAAEELAERAGRRDEVEYRLQNIAEDAEGVPEAAVVVMHRVICCYPELYFQHIHAHDLKEQV
jgi:magnesium-protoporphyrin O-methyltransferase